MHMLPSPLPSPSTPSSASPPPSLPVSNVAAPWTAGEDALLLSTYYRVCDSSPPSSGLWKLIASSVASRNARQCSRRWTTLQASASAERRFDCESAFTPADRVELALAVRRHGRRFVLISDNYFPRRAPHFLINRAQEQTL
ncbi:hypothetical protein GQ42DRAFT_165533 [Ramicandelaber brevisporus]|nr:hypothetical protein GQ42DRAFT_165533 [Ramicandelaber brevisporus]